MAVSATADVLAWARQSGAAQFDNTFTISSGSNLGLVAMTTADSSVTFSALTWRQGETNEAVTKLGDAISGTSRIAAWFLAGPSAAATKTLRLDASGAADLQIAAIVLTGGSALSSSGLTTNTAYSSGTAIDLSGSAGAGAMSLTGVATTNTVDATDQTSISITPGVALAAGFDRASSGFVHHWTTSGGTQVAIGFVVSEAGGVMVLTPTGVRFARGKRPDKKRRAA